MPSSSTYGDLKQLARDHIKDGSTTFDDRIIERAVIAGLEELTQARNWSWFKTDLTIQTIAPYDTGTVSINDGATTVTGSGTTFTSAMVGRFIQFEDQRTLYRITGFTNSTTITIEDAYVGGGSNLSGADYEILAISYDLPDDFSSLNQFLDVADIRPMKQVPADDMRLLHANYAGSSDPYIYAIRQQYNDAGSAIWFYPPPSSVQNFWITYVRYAGWRNATTNAYEQTPSADTSLVDWNPKLTGLLRKAIIAEAWSLAGNDAKAARAERAYYKALGPAMKKDNKRGGRKFLGMTGGRLPSIDSFKVSPNVQG